MTPSVGHDAPDAEPPVIRDKRRFNPDGSAREPAPSGPAAAPAAAAPAAAATADAPLAPVEPVVDPVEAAEAMVPLGDLQRLKAEYDNYRRRTDRDRQAVGELATAQVLSLLLPVLDDVERARAHGDLTGAFAAVGDALTQTVTKLGLETYGATGDAFDPQLHDAVLTAAPMAGASTTVVAEAFRPGYRFAGRVLRPAQVAVAEPADDASVGAGPADTADVPAAGGDTASDPPAGA